MVLMAMVAVSMANLVGCGGLPGTEPTGTATLLLETNGDGSITATTPIAGSGPDDVERCPGSCEVSRVGAYAIVSVTHLATPDEGHRFERWEGDCWGTNAEIHVSVDKGELKTCVAVFRAL
jgi:hypothetical protein